MTSHKKNKMSYLVMRMNRLPPLFYQVVAAIGQLNEILTLVEYCSNQNKMF